MGYERTTWTMTEYIVVEDPLPPPPTDSVGRVHFCFTCEAIITWDSPCYKAKHDACPLPPYPKTWKGMMFN